MHLEFNVSNMAFQWGYFLKKIQIYGPHKSKSWGQTPRSLSFWVETMICPTLTVVPDESKLVNDSLQFQAVEAKGRPETWTTFCLCVCNFYQLCTDHVTQIWIMLFIKIVILKNQHGGAETSGSLRVGSQPDLHSETLAQNKTKWQSWQNLRSLSNMGHSLVTFCSNLLRKEACGCGI